MKESSRRLRKTTRTGAAAASVIALALGGLTLVGPGPMATKATAASSFTGGLRGNDGEGAVERDQQKPSDLLAGACTVQSGAASGSRAGFSWQSLEPGPGTPVDKQKDWGLSLAFDNSQDRTFADWSFGNSGNHGDLLNVGSVSSMDAGTAFPVVPPLEVTAKADESINITAARSQRNLNVFADLTKEEVEQFAEAGAGNPVRYAWQGKYTRENVEGPKASQGGNARFTAVVNPWPSENIECNPITVSWERISKHVIVPNEETKIGHINIPEVQNGGTDDSLSRMIVEAYDGNGDFIGTSNTEVSGGDQRLRIDGNGDIFYTWPEYRGTDLAAQQNVNFSVLAQPRSVDQLQAAVENNNYGQGAAFDSSNSLPRYNKPNVVDNRSFSLDDTADQNPQYDKNEQTIISGVDSDKGPLAQGRQTVTFKQVPDMIADLVKKRGDGGYEATVKLNNDYVFDGWDATLDPETNNVTITAPLNPFPGTFAQARVVVTYSNGSKDELPLLVVVQENDTQTTDVSYPFKRASQNVQMTSDPQLTRILKKNNLPPREPKSYAIREDWTAPEGWEVKINEKTGEVTAKSAATVPDNTVLEVPVVATYNDTTTDETIAKFQVASSVKVPGYDAASGKPAEEVKLPAKMPKIGLGGNEDDEEPNRYTFENGETTFEPKATDPNYQWKFVIDPDTGEITATVPKGGLPGGYYTIPVKVHYGSGAPSQNTTATVTVVGSGDGEDTAHYIAQSTQAGKSVDSKINSQLSDPTLAKYELGTVPEGWTATVAEDGTVTATPDENQKPGTEIEVPVNITYPGGGRGSTTAKFIVVGNDAQNNNPLYPTVSVPRGTTAYSTLDTSHLDMDKVEFFHIITDPNDKGYVAPPKNLDLNKVVIDENGNITTPVSKNALPGSSADIPVRVTYKDGSVDYTVATVVVKAQRNQVYEPHYSLKETTPGKGVTSEPLADTVVNKEDLGEQGFTVPEEVDGWKVTVDKETGAVTTTPPATARAGDKIEVPVTVNYEDGSSDTVLAPFVVREKQSEIHEPSYSVESTKPGGNVKHSISNAPEGVKFDVPQYDGGWKYSVDDAGNVTATAPQNAKPGDKKTTNVTVTYPDGSTDTVPVTTVVSLTNNYEAEPFYPAEKSYPGETATSPLNVRKAEGIDLAEENPFAIIVQDGFTPTGQNNAAGNPIYRVSTANGAWLVSLDEDGNVKADIPATAQPGDSVQVPVRLTYSDGSTDTTTAPITVVDNPTRPIPFKVEYQYDATMPAGKSEVVTQGEAGSEKQLRDGTWETTKSAVNEVVKIGIKPAENSEDVTWTVPIPYSTETRPNPALAPGETKVVQEGVDGERTFTAKFRSVGDESYVVDAEDNKQPVKEIIEYGPRLDDQELKTETERKIPFETTIVADPTLEAGKQVVDTQGIVGVEKVTSTQKIVDGKPSGDPVVTTQTTTEKQDAVIRVGTKTEGETTNSTEVETSYPVRVVYDPNLKPGESKVTQEGKPGKKKVTITQPVVNSKPNGEATVTEEVTKDPVEQVVTVGTKPDEAKNTASWTAQVPYGTVIRPNTDLKPGEVKTVQEGEYGERKFTADFSSVGSGSTVNTNVEETKAPKDQIIEYGPTIADQKLTSTTKNPVPFNTTFIADDTLPAGEQVVDTQGVNGEDTVTSVQEIKDGKPVGEPTITTERSKEPVNAVVRVGTKTTGTVVSEFEAAIEPPVQIEYDPELPAGTSKVANEGAPGKKTVTVTRDVENSAATGKPTVTETVTEEPTPRVIKVGTKQATATDSVEWTEPIPFSTTVRPNSELAPGETKVVQEGKDGKVSYKATFTGTNGEATVEETKDRTEPTEQIIEYGPRLEDQDLVTTTERQIPFETTIIADPNLEAGEQVVEKQGVIGKETVTSTQKLVDGKPSGDPVVTTNRTTEKQDAVIRVGTKVAGDVVAKYDAKVPYPTQFEYDPELPAGETKVTQEGKDGEKTVTVTQPSVNGEAKGDPKVEEKVTTEPTPRIVKVGTKPAENSEKAEWTVPIPYSTTLRPNPDLAPGETKVVQQGVNGERTFTALFRSLGDESYVVESKDTKDPVEEIVEYGPRLGEDALVTETSNVIPFDTEIIPDDTLPAGTQEIETQGFLGYERVTSTQKLVDGKPSGDPVVTTERTKDPVNAVIRVGTKTEGQTVNSYEAEIPFPVRVEYDPKMPAGESKVTQDGKPGKKTVTVTQPVVNSQSNGEATTTEQIVEKPVEQVITVGIKPAETSKPVSWTAQIPFETVVRPNPALKPGEVKTVQDGEYGEKKFTAHFRAVGGESYVVPDEEITKQPKQQIIEYGPTIDDQTLTSTTTRPIQFKTNIIFDQNLPAGEQRVIQGENGEETVTSTQEIKDGKPVGEPKITTNVTKAPKDAEIRVGTKVDPTTVTTTIKEVVPAEPVTTTVTTVENVPTTITETKEVPTTVTTEVPTTVTTTVTEAAEPVTSVVTTTVPTTVTTAVPTTVTKTTEVPVTTTVPGSAAATTTKVISPEVDIEVDQGSAFDVVIADEAVDAGSFVFQKPSGGVKAELKDDGKTLVLDAGTYTVEEKDGKAVVHFVPKSDFTGNVPDVKVAFKDNKGTEAEKPLVIKATYKGGAKPAESSKTEPTPNKPSEPTTVKPAPNKPVVIVDKDALDFTAVKGDKVKIGKVDFDKLGAKINPDTLEFKALDKTGAKLSNDKKKLTVSGEGEWTIDNGQIIFTPEEGFTGDLTKVELAYKDADGKEGVLAVQGHYVEKDKAPGIVIVPPTATVKIKPGDEPKPADDKNSGKSKPGVDAESDTEEGAQNDAGETNTDEESGSVGSSGGSNSSDSSSDTDSDSSDSDSSGLASTGANVLGVVGLGLALLLAGVFITRRKRGGEA